MISSTALANTPSGPAADGRLTHVVVTGAAGFIGSHLAAWLLEHGATVTGVDRRSPDRDPGARANLAAISGCGRFRLVVADLAQADLAPMLNDAQVVFHLAAAAGVRCSWGEQFADYVTSNVLSTQRLLEACRAARVPRLVAASSSSVYGQASGRAFREGDPLSPLSPYGVTKLAAERLCLAYANRPGSGTDVVALRYFTVYGPHQRPDMLISRLMRAALTGEPVTLYGTGKQRRDFTHVSDVVAATVAAASAETAAAVVNVGTGTSVSVAKVIAMVEDIAGQPVPLLPRMEQPGDVQATAADLTRAQELLGYHPRIRLADGLRRQWEATTAQRRDSGSTPSTLQEVS